MIERRASVLMFGARFQAYTFFHTAEDAAEVPYLYEPSPYNLLARNDDGSILSVRMKRQDMSVARRFVAMDSWLETRGLLVRKTLGCGELLFIPDSSLVHDEIVAELRKDPLFLVAQSARPAIALKYGVK